MLTLGLATFIRSNYLRVPKSFDSEICSHVSLSVDRALMMSCKHSVINLHSSNNYHSLRENININIV